jgi:heavy metal translocating P-type ATPase
MMKFTGAAAGSVTIRRVSTGCLRVARGSSDDPGRALVAWLSERPEVIEVRRRESSATADVRFRDQGALRGALVRSVRDRVAALDAPREGAALHVELQRRIDGRARYRVHGAAADDVRRLAAWVAAQKGVSDVQASAATGSLLVRFDAKKTDAEALLGAIRASDRRDWPEAARRPDNPGWGATAYNTALLVVSTSGLAPPVVTGAAIAVAAIPAARRAIAALGERRLSVDFLDLAAIVMSVGTGQHTTGAFITWLLSIGDVILDHTTDRARGAIANLMKLDVQDVWRVRGSTTEQVPLGAIVPGDRIVVDAGASIAADGSVVSGVAVVDEKALTGESIPHEKQAGDRVLAATVVLEGQLIIEVERTGADTTAARIVQILEGVGSKPMTLQREIERKADWLVLPTIGVACAAALLSGQVHRMTSVLITDFGTGIRIAAPTSVLATMTMAARDGVLVKGGHYLERLARTDTIVFDKTGTLTRGTPRIVRVTSLGGMRVGRLVGLAAAAEARQKHPIAEAIRQFARDEGAEAVEAELGSESYTIGVGLSACVQGRSVLVGGGRLMSAHGVSITKAQAAVAEQGRDGVSSLFVAVDGELEGVLGYADELREESRAVVRALRAGGRREIVLMSGDAGAAVEAIARSLGIQSAAAELLPADKASAVRDLQRAGRTVAMVGDGINDAPALAAADVGVSLDGGTDVALEVADVVLLRGGLSNLPRAFGIADRAMYRVRRGVGLVVVPNVAAMALGALGLLSPGLAATINNGSTVFAALVGLGPVLLMGKRQD